MSPCNPVSTLAIGQSDVVVSFRIHDGRSPETPVRKCAHISSPGVNGLPTGKSLFEGVVLLVFMALNTSGLEGMFCANIAYLDFLYAVCRVGVAYRVQCTGFTIGF